MSAALVAAGCVGFIAGAFIAVLVLVAVDSHLYGRRRRPALDAARHGARGSVLRVTGAPSTSTAVVRKARP